MYKRSERTATIIERDHDGAAEDYTINGFMGLLHNGYVARVTLKDYAHYRSTVLSDRGSQFTVYTGDGVHAFDKGLVVVKCAKLRIGVEPLSADDNRRERASALYREVQILTNPKLRSHANIVSLFWYDFVEVGENVFIPALIMERATFGNLNSLLYYISEELTEPIRIKICADITFGLLALHKAGVVHGDVKTENILVFGTEDDFIPKIADFGSVILLNKSEDDKRPWRYYGTPLTNAPEVENQTASKLDKTGLLCCDTYSLGLLIVEVMVGILDSAVTKKDENVLQHAISMVSDLEMSKDGTEIVSAVLSELLQYSRELRCSDLVIIHNIFNPLKLEDLSIVEPNSSASRFRDDEDVEDVLNSLFGLSDYLSIDLDVELESERDTQRLVYERLLKDAESSNRNVSGKALFQLAIASAIGFGTPYDEELFLAYAIASAKKGYLPAQANVLAFHIGLNKEIEFDNDEIIDWLFEATAWGSYVAATCLERRDREQFLAARAEFHKAGGFNQFFYTKDPPVYIGSIDFVKTLTTNEHERRSPVILSLAQSAAIYGDARLLRHLMTTFDLDPNLTNTWGESLMNLCCKAGHVEVLRVLVESKATATLEGAESPLHWLIAFDEEDIEAAVGLLVQAGANLDSQPDVSWNHPSIDMPGRFPIGSPMHYAMFFDSAKHMKAITDNLNIPLNWTGSSESTSIEYGISRRKVRAAEILISKGALNDISENNYILAEIGMTLVYMVWIAVAVTQQPLLSLTERSIDLVLEKRPELLDYPSEGGFTPLMSAVLYHDRATTKVLLDRGCDVNAQTPPEFDGRTALNSITDLKIQYPDDDILELLKAAGADFDQRSVPGGNLVLHFAARDDNANIVQKLINMGVNINDPSSDTGFTPLHKAAHYGSYTVAKLLLEHNANIEAVHAKATMNHFNWDKLTPLAIAAYLRRSSIINLFLENGASPFARPSSGHTVFHLSITEDDAAMLKVLLAIPELLTAEILNHRAGGTTALHLCAGNLGRHEYMSLLLDAGADPNICTESGHSVLDIAKFTRDKLSSWLEDFDNYKRNDNVELLAQLVGDDSTMSMLEPLCVENTPVSFVVGEGDNQQEIYMMMQGRIYGQLNSESEQEVTINLQHVLQQVYESIKLLESSGARAFCSDIVPDGLCTLHCPGL